MRLSSSFATNMPLGPFDARKKSFRCSYCVTKHLKCSGSLPCTNCQKKGYACHYATAKAGKQGILIHQDTLKTIQSYTPPSLEPTKLHRSPPLRMIKSPQQGVAAESFYYFEIFMEKNKFSRQNTYAQDVKILVQSGTAGACLKDAILAIGAMASVKVKPNTCPSAVYRFALTSYANSVHSLRNAINDQTQATQLQPFMLWTTLMLGVFELMVDPSGQGWVQHLVHGTSKALIAAGPQACENYYSRRFFTEVKVFEVCRAIVFNAPSFLTESHWTSFSKSIQLERDDDKFHPLDELLDIMLSCSALRVRAISVLYDDKPPSDDHSSRIKGQKVIVEGCRLRKALEVWFNNNRLALLRDQQLQHDMENQNQDDFDLLSIIFHAAISIYLSGIFDYEVIDWIMYGTLLPILGEEDIQLHVSTIIKLTQLVLDRSRLSPILLLFPIRVAGARSWDVKDKQGICGLLEQIEKMFSAAGAFKIDLEEVWSEHDFEQRTT